jgi:hypothetical protein
MLSAEYVCVSYRLSPFSKEEMIPKVFNWLPGDAARIDSVWPPVDD